MELFRSAIEQLRFVTTMFWQQAGFFLLIQSGLLAVVSQWLPKGTSQRVPLLVLSLFGLVLALFWGWVAGKRLKIIEYWRSNVASLDKHPLHLYKNLESDLDKDPFSRPTSLTRFLPYGLAVLWIALFITSIFWLPMLATKTC